jgi:hypothetical protein
MGEMLSVVDDITPPNHATQLAGADPFFSARYLLERHYLPQVGGYRAIRQAPSADDLKREIAGLSKYHNGAGWVLMCAQLIANYFEQNGCNCSPSRVWVWNAVAG